MSRRNPYTKAAAAIGAILQSLDMATRPDADTNHFAMGNATGEALRVASEALAGLPDEGETLDRVNVMADEWAALSADCEPWEPFPTLRGAARLYEIHATGLRLAQARLLRGSKATTRQPAILTHGQAAGLLYEKRGGIVTDGTCRKDISTRLKAPEHRGPDGKGYQRSSVLALARELEAKAVAREG